MASSDSGAVFDYRALRLMMGLIAFSLPFVVSILSSSPLPSISASYHTEARDAFVGMLFIVSAFLWAYKGHSPTQAWASKAASLAAAAVAVFPTACADCPSDTASAIHYGAAVLLFAILAFFCFGPFQANTWGRGGKKGRRSRVYVTCGCVMLGSMITMGLARLFVADATLKALAITYWGEAVALWAFGVAWIVAGKYFRVVADDDEALTLL